jgi:hypothetical protein
VHQADAAPEPRGNPQAYIFFQSGFREHARLVSGRWPQSQPGVFGGGGLALEVGLGAAAARHLGWSQGARVFLVPFNSDPQEKIALTVVGILEPRESQDPYWLGDLSAFRAVEAEDGTQVPMYVQEAGFFGGLGVRYPMLLGSFRWHYVLDTDSLTAAKAVQARVALEALETDVNRIFPRSLVFSSLGWLVEDYLRSLSLARVPLFLFTSLVVGSVLYYLVLVSGLLARGRGPEAAVLGSRGATPLQVASLLGLGEGLVVVLPAVVAGPFLGAAIARVLPMGDYNLGEVSAGFSPSVFLIAVAAGAVCLAVFFASGLGVARRGIVQFPQSRARPLDNPARYRYAVDLLVLVTGGLIWWQVQGRGGFLTRRLSAEGMEADLSLLLGPALFLLAVGLLLLRVMPSLLRLLAWLADPLGVAWVAHGFRRMARDPFPSGALAVLLMLATALGVFGAIFGATLTRSQQDQARYAVGGDVLVSIQGSNLGSRQLREQLLDVAGVRRVVPAYRGALGARSRLSGGGISSLLAVDPVALPRVAWFRRDFGAGDLQELLSPLRWPGSPQRGVSLPQGTDRVGVWARAERPYPFNLWIRLRDSEGRYTDLLLGDLRFTSWRYLEAPLPENRRPDRSYTIVAFNLSGPRFASFGQGSLVLDDVTAMVGEDRKVVEGFETRRQWAPVPNLGLERDSLRFEAEAARSGKAGALLAWSEPIGGEPRGIFLPLGPFPIPALGSADFTLGQEVVGRVGGQPVRLVVRGTVDYFPTLFPRSGPFLLVNLEHLSDYLRILPLGRPPRPTEFWIGLSSRADRPQTLTSLREITPNLSTLRGGQEEADRARGNPLAGGAWDGLALVGLGALGGVAVLGFALYAAQAVQRARLELGLLRALGFTRRQVGLMLALEGLLVSVLAAAVGGVAGAWVARWTLGNLDVTVRGNPVVPPMVLAVDGQLAFLTYLALALAVDVATFIAVALTARLRLHDVLRVGE